MEQPEDEISHPLLAKILDFVMRPLFRFRERVVPGAEGRVLEIGVGTGLNLPLYDATRVTEVVGIEPDASMRARAETRVATVPVRIMSARGEALPFDDAAFDTVVLTFVLCTVEDTASTLSEIFRVLKPGGRLLFAEHVRSVSTLTASVQRGLNPIWKRCAGGCHLDRDAAQRITDAGFHIDDLQRRGSRATLSPIVYGHASPPPAS